MAQPTDEEIAAWVARLTACYGKTVAATIECGRELIKAKKALQHGRWCLLLDEHFPFNRSYATRVMKIAKNPAMANPANWPRLPSAWTTLYAVLTKFKAPVEVCKKPNCTSRAPCGPCRAKRRQAEADLVQAAIDRGAVQPMMKPCDVRALGPERWRPYANHFNSAQAGRDVFRAFEDYWLRKAPANLIEQAEALADACKAELQRRRLKRAELPEAGIAWLRKVRGELLNVPDVNQLAWSSVPASAAAAFNVANEDARRQRRVDREVRRRVSNAIEAVDHVLAGRVCGEAERVLLDNAWTAAQAGDQAA